MPDHPVVSREQWLVARKDLLEREKAFTKERDALSQRRRELPWVKIDKPYVFAGASGNASLADLFDGRSQLIVYHFMFDPSWEAGCKSCSFWADNFERNVIHLAHRDVSFVAISRAPLAKLVAYRKRMGWTFPWLSSHDTDFNYDFGVSFRDADAKACKSFYNYEYGDAKGELHGISVFKLDAGAVFHTYSCYSRGLDMLNAGYHYLDLVPKGRDEANGEAWLRRRDEYETRR